MAPAFYGICVAVTTDRLSACINASHPYQLLAKFHMHLDVWLVGSSSSRAQHVNASLLRCSCCSCSFLTLADRCRVSKHCAASSLLTSELLRLGDVLGIESDANRNVRQRRHTQKNRLQLNSTVEMPGRMLSQTKCTAEVW